jgi:AcrR family transcriptional regulator
MSPEARRASLLAGARRVFAAKGYHRAGISDIVTEVGVARGTFYRYFESKRAVFAEVIEAMMAEVVGVVRPIDVSAPIGPQVDANVERLIRAITDEEVCRVLFTEAMGIDAEGDEALRSFYAAALGRIEAALQTGQALGVVRPADERLVARLLLGLIKEPVVQATLDGERVDAAGLVRELTQLLRGGLLVRP